MNAPVTAQEINRIIGCRRIMLSPVCRDLNEVIILESDFDSLLCAIAERDVTIKKVRNESAEAWLENGSLKRTIQRLQEPVTAQNYGPTLAAEINALPSRLRSYVHDLETRADPTWDLRRAFAAEEKAQAAELLIQEMNSLLKRCHGMLGYLSDMHSLSPMDRQEVTDLRDALAQPAEKENERLQAEHWQMDVPLRMGQYAMSELQKYTYEIDIEHRSLSTSEGEAAYDGQKFYDACDSDAARAADQATIAELRERLARSEAAHCERICAAIKAADDKSSDGGYMYDSDDCISVVREYFSALAAADGGQSGGAQ